ncbi:MAG: YifB family Mg chelatase-like AAA ATPase [Acetobacterium sp.]
MLSQIKSSGLMGVNGVIVTVEIDVSRGLPSYALVGLPDTGIKESKDRVFAAIKNNGFQYPMERITINLAPADLKKEGPAFDLAIALGILVSSNQLTWDQPEDYLIVGELSLSGEIRSVNGILPMVLEAKKAGIHKIFVPYDNRFEAAVVQDVDIYPVKNLSEAVSLINGELLMEPFVIDLKSLLTPKETSGGIDFSDIRGQDQAKRALEIAAAGSHNLLMSGPPGSGKTMLAKGFPSILPDLTLDEALEITKIHSISGLLKDNAIMCERPFRAPHHTISKTALVGGGRIPKPGEVSLAHLGVLFLDELPEFQKSALEVLRQPIEDQEVCIARVNASLTFPASFTLITSMNPCACGYLTDPTHECICTPQQIKNYQGKISGPLMDRLDIFVDVPPTTYDELQSKPKGDSSRTIKQRVDAARNIQNTRYKHLDIYYNAQLTPKLMEIFCILGTAEQQLMEKVYAKMNLSARGYHRILKLARTIADLDNTQDINVSHLSEAIQYRGMLKSH